MQDLGSQFTLVKRGLPATRKICHLGKKGKDGAGKLNLISPRLPPPAPQNQFSPASRTPLVKRAPVQSPCGGGFGFPTKAVGPGQSQAEKNLERFERTRCAPNRETFAKLAAVPRGAVASGTARLGPLVASSSSASAGKRARAATEAPGEVGRRREVLGPSFGRKRRPASGGQARHSLSSGSGQLAFPPRSPPLAAPGSKGAARPALSRRTAPSLSLSLRLPPGVPSRATLAAAGRSLPLRGDAGSRSSRRAGASQGSRSVPIVLSQRAARLRGCRARVRRQSRAEVEVIPEE